MLGGATEATLRRDLVERARSLYTRGLITALDGNLSVRFGGRWLLATPSGFPKQELDPEDVILLDLGPGAAQSGEMEPEPRTARARRGLRPSSELAMHMAIYAARPDAGAVVHAHPPTAVGLTLAERPVRLDICPEAVVFLGQVGMARYATPGTDDLAQSLVPLLSRCHTMLLARHGAVTLAADLAMAYQRMEALEHVAKIYLAARQLGPVTPLPEEEQRRLRRLAGIEATPEPSASEADPAEIAAIVEAVLEALRTYLPEAPPDASPESP